MKHECIAPSAPGTLAVLGSTGSIGRQTLQVVRDNPGRFKIACLVANTNVELVCAQAREFSPEFIAMADPQAAQQVRSELGPDFKVEAGEEAVSTAAAWHSVHTVVCAVVGFAGFAPLLSAIACGKHVALANKESLVAAGTLVHKALEQSTSVIVPVDSEHNSVFQCLLGRGNTSSLRRIILTASGGPFLDLDAALLARVRPEQAIRHPRWSMGRKISVDSATLMNKGLEVIEASMLFNLPGDKIDVLIHPESIVHGLAEYEDGTVIAALFETDMRVPIAFALSYLLSADPAKLPGSEALSSGTAFLSLAEKKSLHFSAPNIGKFPALGLCYRALALGGGAPAALSAANEVAVEAYLADKIGFMDIPAIAGEVLELYAPRSINTANDVVCIDSWARQCASNILLEQNRNLTSLRSVRAESR